VTNDWTVRYKNRFLQILKQNRSLPRPKERVTVRRLLDGQIQLLYRNRNLAFKPVTPSRGPVVDKTAHRDAQKVSSTSRPDADQSRRQIPSKNHPWRRDYRLMWERVTR
jgi:hypothetical protein